MKPTIFAKQNVITERATNSYQLIELMNNGDSEKQTCEADRKSQEKDSNSDSVGDGSGHFGGSRGRQVLRRYSEKMDEAGFSG